MRERKALAQPSAQSAVNSAATSYTLFLGDCLEVMPTLEKGSVACVFADIPYGTTDCAYDKKWADLGCFISATKLVRKSNGALIMTADMKLSAEIISQNKEDFRLDLVWDKVNWCTGHLQAKAKPLRRHEHVLVFGRPPLTYNPQMTVGSKPYAVKASRNYKRPHWGGRQDVDRVNFGTRYPTTVCAIKAKTGTRTHPAQKPVALLEWLIATYTNPGDLVLDPVFGSNTTGVACARLGRRYIGIEKDAAYFAAGKARLEAEHARLAEQPAQGALAI